MSDTWIKTCFKCGEQKPNTEFYRHAAMADGHLGKCKYCTRKDARVHRRENPEKVRAYDNARARLPHRKAYRDAYSANYPEREPLKAAAHTAVSNAVRSGKLVKSPCAFCGAAERVEAHHHDYSKPLDVTWLCKPCHRRFHALERMATYRADEAA
jgi:hypothetical protein